MRDNGLVDLAVVEGLFMQRALRFRDIIWATEILSNSDYHSERAQRAVKRA